MARSSTSFNRGHKPMGGRPKGSRNKATIEVRDFAWQLIEEPAYQERLRQRVIEGKAPQMEMLLFKYAYGQPVGHHEVNAEVTAVGLTRSAPMGPAPARGHYSDGSSIINGGVVPSGRPPRRRTLMERSTTRVKAGRKSLAPAGQLPPGIAPPPGAPA